MPKPANPDPAYQAKLAAFERLVATAPGLELKGAANPYVAVNGNMIAYLHPRGALALRLPPAEREAFLAAFETTLFEAYGVTQKEYVTVPDALLGDTDRLRSHFQAAIDYVSGLKPKPTTKAKKT
jgi:hypothetical protein